MKYITGALLLIITLTGKCIGQETQLYAKFTADFSCFHFVDYKKESYEKIPLATSITLSLEDSTFVRKTEHYPNSKDFEWSVFFIYQYDLLTDGHIRVYIKQMERPNIVISENITWAVEYLINDPQQHIDMYRMNYTNIPESQINDLPESVIDISHHYIRQK